MPSLDTIDTTLASIFVFEAVVKITALGPLAYWANAWNRFDLSLVVLGMTEAFITILLRSGAMAANSPIMQSVKRRAERGVPVLGVCNGFQVLTEAGLLPGALMRNASQNFICRTVALKVENDRSLFTSGYEAGQIIDIPVAHHDGNYFADDETLDMLEGEGRVAFRYVENCNGSQRDIAGILSPNRRVLGMMPHPERVIEPAHGSTDGKRLFDGLVEGLMARA